MSNAYIKYAYLKTMASLPDDSKYSESLWLQSRKENKEHVAASLSVMEKKIPRPELRRRTLVVRILYMTHQ